jgi:hypothetical protein
MFEPSNSYPLVHRGRAHQLIPFRRTAWPNSQEKRSFQLALFREIKSGEPLKTCSRQNRGYTLNNIVKKLHIRLLHNIMFS